MSTGPLASPHPRDGAAPDAREDSQCFWNVSWVLSNRVVSAERRMRLLRKENPVDVRERMRTEDLENNVGFPWEHRHSAANDVHLSGLDFSVTWREVYIFSRERTCFSISLAAFSGSLKMWLAGPPKRLSDWWIARPYPHSSKNPLNSQPVISFIWGAIAPVGSFPSMVTTALRYQINQLGENHFPLRRTSRV